MRGGLAWAVAAFMLNLVASHVVVLPHMWTILGVGQHLSIMCPSLEGYKPKCMAYI